MSDTLEKRFIDRVRELVHDYDKCTNEAYSRDAESLELRVDGLRRAVNSIDRVMTAHTTDIDKLEARLSQLEQLIRERHCPHCHK